MLGARRVGRTLLAATKADHLNHCQHAALTAITEALLRAAKARANSSGVKTMALSLFSLCCTQMVLVENVLVITLRAEINFGAPNP